MHCMGNIVPDLSKKNLISDLTEETIPWKEGKFLFALWQKKRIDGKLPARSDFSPLEMTSILPHLTLLDIDNDLKNTKVRLVGTYITSMMNCDVTGQTIGEIPTSEPVIERLTWLLKHKKPYMQCGVIAKWSKVDFRDYNILVLPLANDGINIDKVMALITESKK